MTSSVIHTVKLPRCTNALLYSRQLRRRYLVLGFLCVAAQEYPQVVSVAISTTKPPQPNDLLGSTSRRVLPVYGMRGLTSAITGRRPDETFQGHPESPTGGGHVDGLVSLRISVCEQHCALFALIVLHCFTAGPHARGDLRSLRPPVSIAD